MVIGNEVLSNSFDLSHLTPQCRWEAEERAKETGAAVAASTKKTADGKGKEEELSVEDVCIGGINVDAALLGVELIN